MPQKQKKISIKQLVPLYGKNYGPKEKRFRERLLSSLRIEKPLFWWRERRLWQRVVLVGFAGLTLWTGGMYSIARWYIARHADEPLNLGATFIPGYARSFGLNPEATMQAMIDDLGVRRFRLVSYWETIEPTPGTYDFSELDWQFAKAEAANAKVSLAIGLRQPRWPECHAPDWANVKTAPEQSWYPALTVVMTKIIERYRSNPALESYQLENEYFLKAFGECKNFSRDRLIDEAKLVKRLDPNHRLVITRSNNALGLPIGKPTPDVFGVSVYKRVWDRNITKRYFEYPFPAWFYAFLAGAGELLTGKDMIIHELQSEPWPPDIEVKDAPSKELAKSLDARRLKGRFDYGIATGIKTIDLWGAEYWYYQKVIRGDSSLWDVAKNEFLINR